jgi:hypothetical protein
MCDLWFICWVPGEDFLFISTKRKFCAACLCAVAKCGAVGYLCICTYRAGIDSIYSMSVDTSTLFHYIM